jgi:hypothetical protein
MTNKKEYILCAAIWYKDGIARVHQPRNISEGFVICGWRHHNCIMTAKIIRGTKPKGNKIASIQGFLTSKDRFLDRKESYLVAVAAGQTVATPGAPTLISEDLY